MAIGFRPLPLAASGSATPAPNGWFGQLNKAPLAIPAAVVAAVSLCPQPITPAVAAPATLDWQAPLAIAPKIAAAPQAFSFVPFDTVQPAAATLGTGWQSQLSTAPQITRAPYAQPQLVPAAPSQASLAWQQPLSTARQISIPNRSGLSFVVPPFEVPRGWYQQLAAAPPLLATPRDVNEQLPFYPAVVTPDNTVTIDKWQRPLATAPPPVTPPQGFSYVPFDTVQIITGQVYTGWQAALGVAPQSAPLARGGGASFVVPQSAVPSGWQSQLSTAPPFARAPSGFTYVPFNTQQVAVGIASYGWLSPLAVAPAAAKPAQGFVSGPYPVPFTVSLAWQQPFPAAPHLAAAPQGSSVSPLYKAQIAAQVVDLSWQQPLAIAPRPLSAPPQGLAFVPFNTSQAAPAGIAGMAWYTPLATPVQRIGFPQSQFSGWVPTQVTAVVETPGVDDWITRARRRGRR